MSVLETTFASADDALEKVIVPPTRDLGGFEVRRALPHGKKQMVGPFIFLDLIGPAVFEAGQGLDVRPHPHIGLSTVTYLHAGSFLHTDSLGTVQTIEPGAVNLMTAGKAITHSERSTPEARARGFEFAGFQTWMALPKDKEDVDPAFEHIPESELPVIEGEGKQVKLILGSMYGEQVDAHLHTPTFYADAIIAKGQSLPFDQRHQDRGIYVSRGRIKVGKDEFDAGQLLVLRPGDAHSIHALENAQVLLLGGDPMDGPRHIWWNFVSSSAEKLEHAKQEWKKADWENGMFQLPQADIQEFIPAP